MEESFKTEIQDEKLETSKKMDKKTIIRHLKFFLIPGWRDEEFSSRE